MLVFGLCLQFSNILYTRKNKDGLDRNANSGKLLDNIVKFVFGVVRLCVTCWIFITLLGI